MRFKPSEKFHKYYTLCKDFQREIKIDRNSQISIDLMRNIASIWNKLSVAEKDFINRNRIIFKKNK